MNRAIKFFVVTSLFTVSCILYTSYVFAAGDFNFTIAPRLGGQDIEFKTVKAGQSSGVDVTLSISSTLAKQYQVSQTLNTQLSNTSGQILSNSNFTVQTIQSSYGTLGATAPKNLIEGQPIILYTSNQNGESDNVLLVYNLQIPRDQPAGIYMSTTSFELRPVDSSQESRVLTINVRVEVETELEFNITQETGGNTIDFGSFSGKESALSRQIAISVEGGLANSYQIMQTLVEPIRNNMGDVLGSSNFSATAASVSTGTSSANNTPVEGLQPLVLFNSDSNGQATSFVVNYVLTLSNEQKAGLYKGMLNYTLQSQGSTLGSINKEVMVNIEPVFDLEVKPLDSQTALNFGTVLPGQTSQTRDILIKVKSNLTRQYQVIQNVLPQLTDASGNTLDASNLFVSVTNIKKGSSQYSNSASINSTQMVLYTSDNEGAPEEFVASYRLSMPDNAKQGNYNVTITYTLSSI